MIMMMLNLITSQITTMPDVFRFSELQNNQYMIVNDTVMGGQSFSRFDVNDLSASYSGKVSLENNGGFASVRMIWPFNTEESQGKSLIALNVKGDGMKYQLRLRTNKGFDGAAYSQPFETIKGQEQIIYFSASDFVPTFRGRTLNNMPELKLSEVKQMGLMVADKQQGPFNIQLFDLKIK
jgi:NADH dehydrogenase [ubiquinone] 1 alpha subcomplex assembly factor 1